MPDPEKRILLLDFDGTVTAEDVFDSIFERFGGEGWREANRSYHREEISLEEAYRRMADTFRGSREELLDFVVATARPREGFRELLETLPRLGFRARIVSNGFDLYILPLLRAWGHDPRELEITCHGAEIAGGRFRALFRPHPELSSTRCLIGKAEIVKSYRRDGWFTAFAGDGLSDSHAAAAADLVFARRRLAECCRREGTPYVPFENFFTVLAALTGSSPF